MRRPRFLWQLYGPTFILVVVAIVAVTVLSNRTLREFSQQRGIADLKAQAYLVEQVLREASAGADLSTVVASLPQGVSTRITLIGKDGAILADSHEQPHLMDNHGTRPEVIAARNEGIGWATRFSRTLGEQMVYVAVKVDGLGAVSVVRTALPDLALANALIRFTVESRQAPC